MKLYLVVLLLFVTPSRVAAAEPQRIISLAPSVTETLFALGVGDRVVGVSVYCDYPPEATKIDRVGNFLTPNVEAIVDKKPDLIIVVPSPGNQNPVETLRRLGFPVLLVDPNTIAQIEEAIVTIAKAVGRETAGQALIATIEQRLAAIRARLAGAPQRKVLMVVGQTPLIAVGAGIFQDELIRMARGVNLGAQAGGSWPHISLELVIAAGPEVIIDTTMGNEERAGSGAALEFWKGFQTIPAVRLGRVHGYKQYQLLRPGPRIPEAFEAIARFVQPERFEDEAPGRRQP
ncbi:MAG: ABC transporter substrate-binding protein [Deltaproteobacteria bacterium]|nr:ABC transporter substrate-binding protein [Deltaproteobacteria bacterium]